MKRIYPLLLMVLAPLAAPASDCGASLDEVLAQHLEARGGREAVERQTALRIRAGYREGAMSATFDFRVMKPRFMRIDVLFADGETYEEGFDGERAWEKPHSQAPRYVGGDAAAALRQSAESPLNVYGLNDMATLGADVSLSGCETLDGTPYYVVNVKTRFGSDIDYYLTSTDFRLERARSRRALHPTQDATQVTIEERWSDFRRVGGVLRPFAQTQRDVASGELLSSLSVEEIVVDSAATPADFALPNE